MSNRNQNRDRELLVSRMEDAFNKGLPVNGWYREGHYDTDRREDGFAMEVSYLDRSVERPDGVSLTNAGVNYRRNVKVQVTITEVGDPIPEVASQRYVVGRGDETEGEFCICIKTTSPHTGWTHLTYAISEGYEKARKEHPEWPEITGWDIGEFHGTLFYMSGPVPLESLVKVHELLIESTAR